jgi:hypothetical protein
MARQERELSGDMSLDKVLKLVRQLTLKAEHPVAPGATPEERASALREQEAARSKADALMLQYAIKEAMLDQARPAAQRMTPVKIEVATASDYDLATYVGKLARDLAKHCRCLIRDYVRWDREERAWMSVVYGWESDVRYFEILYTTLRLHMVGAIKPKIDPALSLDENAYVLRNAGFQWTEIAQMYCRGGDTSPDWQKTYDGIKRAYVREIKRRGEPFVKIPAKAGQTFRRSAAQGYAYRIAQRLRDLREQQGTGEALVLASRADDLSAFFKADNPDLFPERDPNAMPWRCEKCEKAKSGHCREHPRGAAYRRPAFSDSGYQAGVRHANAASLNPEASNRRTPALDS